jgi:hypothetical protein
VSRDEHGGLVRPALLADNVAAKLVFEGPEQREDGGAVWILTGGCSFPRLELTPTRRQGKRLLIVRCCGMDVAPPAPMLPGGAEDPGALGTLTVSSRGIWIPLRKSR